MITFFNRRLLCKSRSVSEKNIILNNLKNAGIEFDCKVKGIPFYKAVSSVKSIFWFNIYVKKCDYKKAIIAMYITAS